jgi:hypothetical protein
MDAYFVCAKCSRVVRRENATQHYTSRYNCDSNWREETPWANGDVEIVVKIGVDKAYS